MQTINCFYSCAECGLKKVAIAVPARQAEDLKAWLERTCITAIAADHRQKSPQCMAQKIDELMIPITGAPAIGAAPAN